LNSAELHAYRDAIITKKSASMAFYRFGRDWDTYRLDLQANFPAHLYDALQK
jgi:glutamate dehydrogenase